MRKAVMSGLVVTVAMISGLAVWSAATDSGTASVGMQLEEIAQLVVSGDPGLITLTNAQTTAGLLPTEQTDATTSLSWTSNVASGSRKITAALSAAYTTGVVLKATLAEPAGSNGTSAGEQTLDTEAIEMFTGIANENCTQATITYEFSLSTMIAPITETESKTVTWTLLAAAA